MTPLEKFQVWLRRAPLSERVTSAVVGGVVLALLLFIVVPVAGSGSGGSTGNGLIAGATSAAGPARDSTSTAIGADGLTTTDTTAATTAGVNAATTSASTGTSGSLAASGATASSGCSSPPGSDQGISNDEIHIAVTVLEAVGPTTNSAFGVPSAEEQQQDYELVIDDLNKHGGVACRKLVAKYYTVNGADENSQKGSCLDIVGSKVFAVIDAGAYYGVPAASCFPQNQMPFFGTGSLSSEQRDQFYPYTFGNGALEVIFRNGVLAFDQAGFFSKDPAFKLGWLYRDCWGSVVTQVRDLLHKVGLKDSQIVDYSLGCPNGGYASPADIQQAILKFQSQGVTHVIESDVVYDFANFTNVAQSQGFKPKYALLDQELIPTTQGNLHVNYDNVDGALVINTVRYGDESAGVAPNAATRRCDAISTAAGKPPTYKQLVGFAGVACNQVWMLAAAIEHAPVLQRKSLAAGLQAAKSIETAYPGGPVDWSGPKTTYGGQFWRLQTFQRSCTCWKVSDPAFHPGFP